MPEKRPLPDRAGDVGRFYFEVVASAAQRTIRWANGQGLLVALVVAGVAAGVQADVEKHVNVWHIVRTGLIATGGLTFVVLLWNVFLAPVRRERDASEKAKAAEGVLQKQLSAVLQRLTNTEFELAREREAQPVFGQAVVPRRIEGRLVRLADLPAGMWLSGRTFENCQLAGPVKLVLAGAHFEHCLFYGIGSRSFVVVEDIDDHMADSIMLHDSYLIGCELHNMTIIGTQQAVDALKASGLEMPGL